MLVALAGHLLGAGQQCLDLAEIDEAVAVVRLLNDAGDDVAHAVLILLKHHVALDLADALQDHLLGGLRGDAAEVLRRCVVGDDPVLGQLVPFDDRLGLVVDRVGIAIGTDVERGALATRALGLGNRDLAHLGRQRVLKQAEGLQLIVVGVDLHDAEVASVAIDLDAGVLALGFGALAIGGAERLLKSDEQHLGVDRLLRLELADCFQNFLAHRDFTSFHMRVDFLTSA